MTIYSFQININKFLNSEVCCVIPLDFFADFQFVIETSSG